jgi:hypothetical protein
MAFAAADKKRLDGRLRWVLVGDRGAVIRDDVPASTAVSAVAEALIGRAGPH